jgi:hypothetical protein
MTCKLCGVEPHADLVDIITRIISGHHNSQITPALGLRAMQDLKNVGLSSTAKRRQKTGMLFSRRFWCGGSGARLPVRERHEEG